MFLICESCSKLVEVDPPITSINGDIVFNDDATAIGVLTGIYANMGKGDLAVGTGWLTNLTFLTGLTSDELKFFDQNNEYFAQYFFNNISPEESGWDNLYRILFTVNSALEKLPEADKLTPSVKIQLLGEAHFVRAFTFFYLVNNYGRVPMPVTSDYSINRLLPRAPENEVYNLIVNDLLKAKEMLSANFPGKDGVTVTNERVRPTKWAATALLSRVYLYLNRNNEAEAEADLIIANEGLFDLISLDEVFLKNSKEAIWQLQPTGKDFDANTKEGQIFNLYPYGGYDIGANPVYLSGDLVKSFDLGDQRLSKWIGTVDVDGTDISFAYKYHIGREISSTEEYSMVLRLGEQYLIRAEAKIRQGRIADGVRDLNKLRTRATNSEQGSIKLSQLSENLNENNALLAVEEERRHELFTEWGHRWFDLKRTNRINEVLSKVKVGWQNTDALFPIPRGAINGENPNMTGDQNPGY